MDPSNSNTTVASDATASLTRESSAGSLYVSAPPSPTPAVDRREHDFGHDMMNATTQVQQDRVDGRDPSPKLVMARLLKGKEKEWAAVAEKGPKRLLDLPVDILREIINQLPHTNDLTSLALCHSAFHALTIPCIYSRFDIVWPDASTHTEPRTGVDALTYGLATLVMAEEIFGEGAHQVRQRSATPQINGANGSNQSTSSLDKQSRADRYPYYKHWRRGNHYAQYTRKFSLGNGPPDWVQEYLITKEGGKMLGTLVALAVARMRNLETFVWDMPTGVLRDVWLALSSLADRREDDYCRLERVWIRWHDNAQVESTTPAPPPPLSLSNIPPPPDAAHTSGAAVPQHNPVAVSAHNPVSSGQVNDRVEHPTFSVLPPLKSLTVLDIDELPYLDEMSILIGRSQGRLRELRVGIARHAQQRDWATAWEGEGIQQVDYSTTWTASSSIGEKRLGGVLGILVGRVCDMRQTARSSNPARRGRILEQGVTSAYGDAMTSSEQTISPQIQRDEPESHQTDPAVQSIDGTVDNTTLGASDHNQHFITHALDREKLVLNSAEPKESQTVELSPSSGATVFLSDTLPIHGANPTRVSENEEKRLDGKLELETLELERVPLSVSILQRAFDWSILTSITLLNCPNHEQLWKALRRTYSPRPTVLSAAGDKAAIDPRSRESGGIWATNHDLNLKKIHTNTVSPALIMFLRETLPANSLEVLFLQDSRSYPTTVTVDSIYRGPVRRHRTSLKKLMIDSSDKASDGHSSSNTRWKKWMLSREILSFITSGRMVNMKELAVAIDYRDWHLFLQRLPLIPQLRSLYIPNIADHARGNNLDPRELALQIVDIVALRPDIEICYMGISNKCFEILENKPQNYDLRHDNNASGTDGHAGGAGAGYGTQGPLVLTSDEEDSDEDDEDDDIDGPGTGDGDDTLSDDPDDSAYDSDDDSFANEDEMKAPRLRLREILFYDDKVAIFKARHGRL